MGSADLNAIFKGVPKKKSDEPEETTSTAPAPSTSKPKERKHILSVRKKLSTIDYLNIYRVRILKLNE